MLVINKIDVLRLDELDAERAALVRSIVAESKGSVVMREVSTFTEEGIMDARNAACDALLEMRVDAKVKGNKAEQTSVLNRIHVAQPKARDDVERGAVNPEFDYIGYARCRLQRFHAELDELSLGF